MGSIQAENTSVIFDSANTYYAKGKYEEAINLYNKIISENKESAALYFNLGNAYFKTNNLGLAILNYERAKKLDPDDEDIEANIKLANQQTEDKIEEAPQLFLSQWQSSLEDIMTEKEWGIFLITCLIVSMLLFIIYVFSYSKSIKQIGLFSGSIVLILAFFSFFLGKSKYYTTKNSNTGIIISPSVTVTGSPSEKGIKLFILHEGVKVNITEKSEDWTEIKIANGNVGWVRSSVLEEI
ncbi:MAG: hypothetical protein K0S44_3010 [Bacteroidetes bacterium]|nr:hypothetical protein [Bacteroidota bacterium]